jgi:hypothetical protein
MVQGWNKNNPVNAGPSPGQLAGWMGGIAATAIAFYLVWHFTEPAPPPPPPVPAVVTFEGMVYSGNAAVANAMVVVELTGTAGTLKAVHDITNQNGAYRFEVRGLPRDVSATVTATASGFQNGEPVSESSPLGTDIREDFSLTPVPGPGPGSAAPTAPEQPGKIPRYVPKSAAEAIRVKIPAS